MSFYIYVFVLRPTLPYMTYERTHVLTTPGVLGVTVVAYNSKPAHVPRFKTGSLGCCCTAVIGQESHNQVLCNRDREISAPSGTELSGRLLMMESVFMRP